MLPIYIQLRLLQATKRPKSLVSYLNMHLKSSYNVPPNEPKKVTFLGLLMYRSVGFAS
jgi:hypothetical protein